jgi:hypothetical protein
MAVVSAVLCVLQGSSETAAECLMGLDDAAALAAAEALVQQLVKAQQQQQQEPDAMQVDATGVLRALPCVLSFDSCIRPLLYAALTRVLEWLILALQLLVRCLRCLLE